MRDRQQIRTSTALMLLLALAAPALWAQSTASKSDLGASSAARDRFIAAGSVSVARPVAGDLIAAGGEIDVSADVGGDVVVAGGNVRVGAPIRQGIYAAGGRVLINAPVQRNVRVAGGRVELGRQARIAGNATIGAGDVAVDGAVGGTLQIGGGHVFINGPIAGDVEVGGGDIELGPDARIEGRVRYASGNEIRRDAAAQVRGGVERIDVDTAAAWPLGARQRPGRAAGWAWTIGLALVAAVLVAALPTVFATVSDTLRTRWALSLLMGFVGIVCIPVAALIALMTVVGVSLGLATIALYLVLLLVGYVAAGIAVGHLALRRWRPARAMQIGWRVVASVLGMLGISILGRVPYIGGLVVLAAMLVGIGALLLQLRPRTGAAAA